MFVRKLFPASLASLLPSGIALLVTALIAAAAPVRASEAAAWAALSQGGIVLFRHSNAPGVGDPSEFRIGDCGTQRNLDDAGRAQARRIGEAFRSRGISVGAVLSSQWCRTRETAELAFPGRRQDSTAFNSFFENRSASSSQTAAARSILGEWRGPGALVVVTHQVNITALTGVTPMSGEGVVIRISDSAIAVVGRLTP